jgi:hypothetical protein
MMRFASNYDDYSQPRASYTAFANLNQQLGGAWFSNRLDELVVEGNEDNVEVYGYRFVQEPATVDVIWSLSPTVVLLPTSNGGAEVVGRDGSSWWVNAEDGMLRLYPSQSPIYVRQLIQANY